MEEDQDEKYQYSLNTTEVILSEVRKKLNSEKDEYFVAFISTPSLFFAFTTDEKMKTRSVLFDHNIYKEETIKGLFVEYYHYTSSIPKKFRNKCCMVICEPSFISPEVIEKYLESVFLLCNNNSPYIFLSTILEHTESLSKHDLKAVKFLPSIPRLVYQYTFFANFESNVLDKENHEILKVEERQFEFTDKEKYKRIKRQKIMEIKQERIEMKKKRQVKNQNVKFYKNEIVSLPHGDFIDNIHKKWFGNYSLLEFHHGYIQWLFPYMSSGGMNYYSESLKEEESNIFQSDENIQKRFVLSYRLILDFYGFELVDEKNGTVQRNEKNWEDRFKSFTFHNNLRITRILKCMNDTKVFNHYKKPFVELLTKEIIENGKMTSSFNSLMHFWIPSLDPNDQIEVKKQLDENGTLKKFLKKHAMIKRQYLKNRKFLKKSSTGGGVISGGFAKNSKAIENKRMDFKKFRAKKMKKKKSDPFSDFLVL